MQPKILELMPIELSGNTVGKVIFLILLLGFSNQAVSGTAEVEVMLEIVHSDGVGADDYPFDYFVWKTQCCKQIAIGTNTQLHYNCQTLEFDDRLNDCEEWIDMEDYK